MTRPGDRLPPAVALDPVPMLAGRPVRPVLAFAPAFAGTFIDATCELHGFDLVHDPPDDLGDWPAAQLDCSLSNTSGAWSLWWPTGTPTIYGVGARCVLWARGADGTVIWLFAGRVTRWDQLADDSISIEAFDTFATLAHPAGAYTAGAPGDRNAARLAALFAVTGQTLAVGADATLHAGQVALSMQQSERSPLAELQAVTASDGGVAVIEPDGRLTTVGRGWRNGRTPPGSVPTISGNDCAVDVVIWNQTVTANDDNQADAVVLSNVAGLTARAGSTTPLYPFAETDLQWVEQYEGDQLAADIYGQLAPPTKLSLAAFDVYPWDPNQPALWRLALDWRLLDRLSVLARLRTVNNASIEVAGDVIVVGTRDAFTVEGGWLRTVTVAPTGPNLVPPPPLVWDAAGAVWDATPTPNAWSW